MHPPPELQPQNQTPRAGPGLGYARLQAGRVSGQPVAMPVAHGAPGVRRGQDHVHAAVVGMIQPLPIDIGDRHVGDHVVGDLLQQPVKAALRSRQQADIQMHPTLESRFIVYADARPVPGIRMGHHGFR